MWGNEWERGRGRNQTKEENDKKQNREWKESNFSLFFPRGLLSFNIITLFPQGMYIPNTYTNVYS